jgi:hypothetical protein
MKYVVETLWYGTLCLLLLWGVLAFVLNFDFLDNALGFWLVAACCGATILYGVRATLQSEHARWDREPCFILATVALLVMAILSDRPYFSAVDRSVLWLPIFFMGIPLGVGVTRMLKSEFRPLVGRDVIVGLIAGIVGVAFALSMVVGVIPFVGVTKITTTHFPGLDFFPDRDTTRTLMCSLPGYLDDWCKSASARDFQLMFASLVQAIQSLIFVVWDTAVLGLGVFVTTWVVRTSLVRLDFLRP